MTHLCKIPLITLLYSLLCCLLHLWGVIDGSSCTLLVYISLFLHLYFALFPVLFCNLFFFRFVLFYFFFFLSVHLCIYIFLFTACNMDITDPSGYIFSPAYSGDSLDELACTWYIAVSRNNNIRLEFQDFHLPDHPTCKGCYLQIFDGSEKSAPALGRFCGYMYPPIVISSSNHLKIALRCAANPYTARFKIFYNSKAGIKQYISLNFYCNQAVF